jgi:hypothetical protein
MNAGLSEVLQGGLPPGFTYQIYAIQLISAKSSREVTLLENGKTRWRGWVQQKQPIRIDFGGTGWRLEPGSSLDIITSGTMKLDVNFLQWGILRVGT